MNRLRAWMLRTWQRVVVAPWTLARARRDLRCGHVNRAKARFLRCTRLAPESFHAHFGLACIYLKERDFSRAQRELLRAQEIAPRRFQACKARLRELVGPLDATGISYGRAALATYERGGFDEPAATGLASDGPEVSPSIGDCTSHAEWIKFQRMGPIESHELTRLDWDQVIASMYGEEA